MSRHRTRRPPVDHRQLIHALNQRYFQQWHRAERLQREVNLLRATGVGLLLDGLRWLRRKILPPRDPESGLRLVRCASLEEGPHTAAGLVSIIIPLKDRLELLRGCLRSMRGGTYRDFEVILVDNGSQERRTLRYLERLRDHPRARVLSCPGAFNFSWLCNQGARAARGDYLLFLNNDVEVLTPDWLERLLRLGQRTEVGAAGATLYYPDGTLQSAGLFPRADGRWVHAHARLPAEQMHEHELDRIRVVPAVAAACLLMRRETFDVVGGFDENLAVTYNDVDLCCRLRQRGLLVAVTPHARLLHYEGLSRGFSGDEPGADHLGALRRFPST
jgi:GT2 family glycosyltransferase